MAFIGGALGAFIGALVVYPRARHKESIGLDEFLALGLIALAYGLAVLSHTYGFLAVLAAGMALQRVKERYSVDSLPATGHTAGPPAPPHQIINVSGPHADQSSADMMRAVRGFNEQMERIGELVIRGIGQGKPWAHRMQADPCPGLAAERGAGRFTPTTNDPHRCSWLA